MPAVNSLLLDTTAVIALFRNEPRAVSTLEPIIELYMPLVALGELYLGIERAQNRTKAAQEVEDLLSFVNVLYPDMDTAASYAAIKARLLARGTPIPDNDIWIAAVARQTRLPLAARDAHFSQAPDIHIVPV